MFVTDDPSFSSRSVATITGRRSASPAAVS